MDLDVDSLTDSLTNSFNLTANCDSVDCYFEKMHKLVIVKNHYNFWSTV